MTPLLRKFKAWLGSLYFSHRRRIVVSVGVSLFGATLLFIAVKCLDINASVANAVLSPPMFFVGFFVIRRFAFADRQTAAIPGLGKWFLKYLAMTPVNQSIYIWLVEVHGWDFLAAKAAQGAAMCLPGYLLTLWVFFLRGIGLRWVAEQTRLLAIRVWALGIEKA